MGTKLFVNLPVKDLPATKTFFSALGFSFNPQFTNDDAACMVIGEDNYAMLLTRDFFAGFITKPVADATKTCEVLVALSLESREAVDAMVKAAVEAGGTTYAEPKDHGFMYQHGFQDLDGHIWEPFWMQAPAS